MKMISLLAMPEMWAERLRSFIELGKWISSKRVGDQLRLVDAFTLDVVVDHRPATPPSRSSRSIAEAESPRENKSKIFRIIEGLLRLRHPLRLHRRTRVGVRSATA